MPDLDPVAVLAATVANFAIGSAYYAVLGARASSEARDARPAPAALGVELLRCLVLATVIAGLAAQTGADDPVAGLLLGLVLWVGFPLVLWTGAILWERTPWRLAALHGGDWLVKLPALGVITSLWQ